MAKALVGEMANEFWRQLQDEVAAWSERNFPSSIGRPDRPILGIFEELGELAEALWKRRREEAGDAIADTAIYMADACAKLGWDMSTIVADALLAADNDALDESDPRDVCSTLLVLVGKAAHHYLKSAQQIRTNEDHAAGLRAAFVQIVSTIWDCWDETRVDRDIPFDQGVKAVWEKVRRRNWRADPIKGGVS